MPTRSSAPSTAVTAHAASTGRYRPIRAVDGVIASEVLPGFRFRIADLLRWPEYETLLDDPVYADFALHGRQRDRARARRAGAEVRRAEREAFARNRSDQQAETERQRAKALAARLRALVLDADVAGD